MNYTELKAAVSDWAHRSDVASQVDTFIDLAEAEFNNRLRTVEQETVADLVCTSRYTALPADLAEIRVVEHNGTRLRNLEYATPDYMARVFEDFMRSPGLHMRRHTVGGDQAFLQQHLGDAQKWQDVARVVSFKAHCQDGVPEGTQVVCFHGVPRPWHVIAPWVPVLEG